MGARLDHVKKKVIEQEKRGQEGNGSRIHLQGTALSMWKQGKKLEMDATHWGKGGKQ